MEHITNKAILKIDHIVLTTADVQRCISFYKKLGFYVENEGNRFALFQGDFKINVHILGNELKPNAHLAKPGTLDICLEVTSNLEEWRDELIAQKIEATLIAQKQGVRGIMKSFYVRDPDRNLVELCHYE